MNAHSNVTGGLAHELAKLEQDLQGAVVLAGTFDAQTKTAEATFKDAVSEVYDAWAPRQQRFDLLRAFCDAKGITWSESKYPKNQFLPIIEHIFDIERAKQSNVSYALAYAVVDKVPVGGFKTWIDDKKTGGFRGAYDKYRQHMKAQAAQAQAGAQAPWLSCMHDAVGLMRALTRSATVVNEDEKHTRQFLLRNAHNEEGKPEGILELVSTAYTFTAARMTFTQPIAEIGGRAYLFSDEAMSDFVALFPTAANWAATTPVDELLITSDSGLTIRGEAISDMYEGLPLRHLASFRSRTDTATAQLAKMQQFDGWLKNAQALVRRPDIARTKFPPSALSRLYSDEGPYGERDPFLMAERAKREAVKRRLPRALDFDGTMVGFMSASMPFGMATMQREHDLFVIPPTHKFETSRECQLHIKHARRLCEVFAANRIQPLCSIAHAHEAESAFVCEASVDGGRFLVAYPTVMNPKGELRCLAEDVDMTALLNSGITIQPSQPQSQSQPQPVPLSVAVPLMMSAVKEVQEQFAAYITSYRHPEEDKWRARRAVFLKQLRWWEANTAVPLHLRLSGWRKEDVDAFNAESGQLLDVIEDYGGSYERADPARLLDNRIECLKQFYESDVSWGIMMDDDAVLYDKAQHNSGPRLFPEMAVKGPAAYTGVDVFFPINPAKTPFNAVYDKDRNLYDNTHVFKRSGDLKGSLFVVRNFRKEGRELVLPPIEYGTQLHGEDTLFAIEALSQGCTVMCCENIILNEFAAPSHFDTSGDRKPAMKQGNERLVELYGKHGLAMKPDSHLLDRSGLYAAKWGTKDWIVKVSKP